MNEITEIQDMVFYGMKTRGSPVSTSSCTLLDYFVPRQYIQIYSQSLINYILRDVGVFLLKFASLVDLRHPDLLLACDGQFDATTGGFCNDVLEILEAGKVLQDANQSATIPAILSSFLCKKYPKVINYINSPTNFIRLVESPIGRENLRGFVGNNFKLSLTKPHIWQKMPATFKPFARRGPGKNYGFHRMTMTNASIISAKMTKHYTRHSQVTTFVPSKTSFLPGKIKHLIDALESFPDAGHKPIFDKYWVVECGPVQVLLGEIDKKCYFIVCW